MSRPDPVLSPAAVPDGMSPGEADDLAFLAGGEVTPEVYARATWHGRPAHVGRAAAGATGQSEADTSDAPVVGLVDALLEEAVRRRASDVHFEPLARSFRVRCRVDGALVALPDPPLRLQAAILSRLKIMAGLSISERRAAQDGRCRLELAGGPVDVRASSLPTVHGESLALRLLVPAALPDGPAALGLWNDDARQIDRLLARPDGLILVTGPTGAGKTTTLYSLLRRFAVPGTKVITVEDPVEYRLPGVNQVQVRPATGLTFAAALRAMLRQAPNVIMIGEIRDHETAAIALNAAQTGHLVLSSLHTNDATGAVTRLLEMGLPPFLVAASLRGVIAQRLVRRICPECARPDTPPARELAALGLPAGPGLRRGVGCARCAGTGCHGRLGLFEVLEIDPALQEIVHRRPGRAALEAGARAAGLRPLRTDAARKVTAGLTSASEVVCMLGEVEARSTPFKP